MPYEHRKTGKNEVTVSKKDGGVVGHTTPGKLNKYLAALHIHSGDKAAQGGIVEIPKGEFIQEHERLIPQLKGEEKQDQKKELKEVRGYAMGGEIQDKVKKSLTEKYEKPEVSYTPPMPNMPHMAGGAYDVGVPQSTATTQGYAGSEPPEMSGASFMPNQDEIRKMLKEPPPNLAFNPQAGMPPAQPAAPAAPLGSPTGQIAPAAATPAQDTGLTDYLSELKDQAGQYSAKDLIAMQNAIQSKNAGFGPSLARAGGTFADALMQGVARAGSGGFADRIANMQEKAGAQQLETYGKAGERNMEQVKTKLALDAKDPTSPLSKSAQVTNMATLVQLGVPRADISRMPADLIGDLVSKRVSLAEAMQKIAAEAEYRKGALDIQRATLGQRKEEWQTGHPWERVMGKVVNSLGLGGDEGTAPKEFPTLEAAQAAGLPPGTRISVGGRTGTIQ